MSEEKQQTHSPTSSSAPPPPSSTARRTIPFPPGVYTFLPLVEACDNVVLPRGPWKSKDCKTRLSRFREDERERKLEASEPLNGRDTEVGGSALEDEDDEEESRDGKAEKGEAFLVPLFLRLPKDTTNITSSLHSTPQSRRGSNSSQRPLFKLTPLPSLRPSSPTSSHPSPSSSTSPNTTQPPLSSSTSNSSQPIGFLLPSVIQALIRDNQKMLSINCRPVWSFLPPISIPPLPIVQNSGSRRSSYTLSRNGSRRGSTSVSGALSASGLGALTPSAEGSGTPATSENAVFVLKDVLEGLKSAERNGAGFSGLNGASDSSNSSNSSNSSEIWACGFSDWVDEESEDPAEVRREHLERVVMGWKMTGEFSSALGGWRNESYSIYGPPVDGAGPLPGSNTAFTLERSACSLFGVATYGVHCTAYLESSEGEIQFWVPRRSATKQTWPSYLDNTVAGGITSGDLPLESIIRECAEEASLPSSFVSANIRSVSVLSYNYRTVEGWIQPEVQYVYDLRLPSDGSVVPSVNDSEVEGFELMSLEEVVGRMVEGEFKPNCALVLIDFFARHGFLTPENDTRYLEIVTRLRQPLVLPGPA